MEDTERENFRIFIQDASIFPEIPKVPLFMRLETQDNDDFDPKVVSLGPYHHGKPELKFVEDFKPKALQMFIHGSNKDVNFFLEQIHEGIEHARSCYLEEFTNKYNDYDFSRMMLLDACFVLNLMERETRDFSQCWSKDQYMAYYLGTGVDTLIRRDMLLLENQVPFQILKLLFNSRFGGDGFEETSKSFCYKILFGPQEPRNNVVMEPQPFHLFELLGRVMVSTNSDHHLRQSHNNDSMNNDHKPATTCCPLVMDLISKGIHQFGHCLDRCRNKEGNRIPTESTEVFRSVTEMKSKGIHFTPGGFGSLMDVRLTSHYFDAELSLPCWYVSEYTRVFFRNMIAYEISPGKIMESSVSSYIYLMKTLIISPNDAKELRRKRIIVNLLGSDEEVVQVFKALNTYGGDYLHIYKDVKKKIEQHYNSKSQTWIAELLDTYFRSPWSLIALVAAVSLLFFTILQTYFASPLYPPAKRS
ncbi:UPF0481 protein At3g47200-like [Lycium ferocissimum]|uniref:UPF0481 protein At3g47200-like n=1 Tax=Lycium ferocissimum TaxID=112874 RepID=UPI0028166F5A|nr:UPF0481 protein At3g47200-like [Lycium ferocissimum]